MRARAFLVIKTLLDRRTREPVPSVPVNYHLDRDSTPLVSPRDPLLSLLSIYLFPLSLLFLSLSNLRIVLSVERQTSLSDVRRSITMPRAWKHSRPTGIICKNTYTDRWL